MLQGKKKLPLALSSLSLYSLSCTQMAISINHSNFSFSLPRVVVRGGRGGRVLLRRCRRLRRASTSTSGPGARELRPAAPRGPAPRDDQRRVDLVAREVLDDLDLVFVAAAAGPLGLFLRRRGGGGGSGGRASSSAGSRRRFLLLLVAHFVVAVAVVLVVAVVVRVLGFD